MINNSVVHGLRVPTTLTAYEAISMNIYTKLPYCVYLTAYFGNKLPPFYIGSTSVKRIHSGYKGSVGSKKYLETWKKEIETNPHLFRTKIVCQFASRIEATECENRLQKKLKVMPSPLYINQSYAAINGYCGMDVSGELNPNYRNKWSDEQRKRASSNSHVRGKFYGIHKITGERKMVSCGDLEYYSIHKNSKRPRISIASKNTIVVRDQEGHISKVSIHDPRYISGELVHHTTGFKSVINKQTGNKERIPVDKFDPIIHDNPPTNQMRYIDASGKEVYTKLNDPRVLSGELVPFSRNRVTVKDSSGKTFSVFKDDPRYLSGELVHHTKGTKNAYDALTGKSLGRIPTSDPRWKEGTIKTKPPL
jgi:hypothetical protein